MAAAAADAGERGRSWYLSKEEIERGSPSRRDGVGAAKEAQLRATYCSFIRDVGLRLQLPQITIATGIVLCHRFYLHQSHAKNEWQTVATVCIFLASKIEDTQCQLQRVVIAAHETMYKKNPVAARRINQKAILEKRKALILVGEALLLSTIRYDFNIQHPYEPLKVALKNLGISQKEVKQAAINLINDTLRTTLVVQFKPHYIAAGSLSLAARFHNVRLPTEKGKIWWHQFDVAPKLLEAAIQQMKELFMKRNPLPTSPAIQPTSAQTPVENQQILSTTPAIRPIPAQTPVEKQHIISTTPAIRPIPAQTPVEKQQKISMTPAIRPIPAQTSVNKEQTMSMTPAIGPIPAQTSVKKEQTMSMTPAIRPIPVQAPVEKQKTISTPPAVRPIPAQTSVKKEQTMSITPAIGPIPAQTSVKKEQTMSMTPAIRPIPVQAPVEKQKTISTIPAVRPILAQTSLEKQQTISTTPAIQPTPVRPPLEKEQIISFPKPVLKYTYSRRGLKRPAPAPIASPGPVKKQKIRSTVGPFLGQEHSTRGGLNRPTTAIARTPALVKKQKIRSTLPVGDTMPTRAPARARTPVRKQQIISTQDSGPRHTHPSVGGERRPVTAPARARTPVRNTQPSVGGKGRSATAPARSPVRKHQIISTPDTVLRHTDPSAGGKRKPTTGPSPARSSTLVRKPTTGPSPARARTPVRKPTTGPSPARARTPVRKQQIINTQVPVLRHTQPSVGGERRSITAPARSPVRKEQIISTPDCALRQRNPSQRGLTSNNFDRDASRCQYSTDSSARNEDSKPLRMHVDHSLNKTAKDGRPVELTLRAALRADVYHVRSEPRDVNMTRVANLVSKKRKIQEAGEHPALVNKPDGDAWTRPQIRSVIVAPLSWKKQKI